MSGRYLLDTNVVIALFAEEAKVTDHLKAAAEVFIPMIVMGELYFGAHKSSRVKENLTRLDEFAANNVILSCDTETARRYGEIKGDLRQKGQPIPENDIWIAAMALQYDLTLVTRDGHFGAVNRLQLEVW